MAGTGVLRGASAIFAVLVLGGGGVREAGGQDIEAVVAGAPDGNVRFEYDARPGVCGDGESISMTTASGEWRQGGRRSSDGGCDEGPVRIDLRVRAGAVFDLRARVGGEWPPTSREVTEIGRVAPEVAADYLFTLAETSPTAAAEKALFPATIARGVETWPRLLGIARGNAMSRVRRQAVFWLGHEVSDRATEGLSSIIADEDELGVREHAVFALAQREEDSALEALIAVARDNPEPMLRKRAIFWLGQRGDDRRVLDFFEELLVGGG